MLRPVPVRLVLLFTPGPTRRKFCVFDESATTIVYLPAFRRVTAFPSSRSRMKLSPTAPWSALPPVIVLGKSFVMFGSVEMTPNSFAYFASWSSCSRSRTELQIGSRTFRVAAGSRSRISSGFACA